MVDSACRIIRDGILEGELAPALMIKDSLHSNPDAGSSLFLYFLKSLASNILSAKAQAKALVVVAFDHSPDFYSNLFASLGPAITTTPDWFQVVDCYTDPLGWNDSILGVEKHESLKSSFNKENKPQEISNICTDVTNLENLMSSIIIAGKGASKNKGKGFFAVAIDLVSIMFRHLSLQSVSNLIHRLRCHGEISSLLWLMHSDLHDTRTIAALEYMSSVVATSVPISLLSADLLDLKLDMDKLAALDGNLKEGKLHLRIKRRNGRVKDNVEKFTFEKATMNFSGLFQGKNSFHSSNVPQTQFNINLTEKEREDRAKVVLPFEHQGNGNEIRIYDGRRTSKEPDKNEDIEIADVESLKKQGKGEIHYIRDSDDETPDSDEDPDDDLDI